jgi:hypothetical protein
VRLVLMFRGRVRSAALQVSRKVISLGMISQVQSWWLQGRFVRVGAGGGVKRRRIVLGAPDAMRRVSA